MSRRKKIGLFAVIPVFAVGLFLLGYIVGGAGTTNQTEGVQAETDSRVLPKEKITVQGLWEEVNEVRAEQGLKALALQPKLNEAAQAKCDDMLARDYWDHNTPDGQEPWVFITGVGYEYEAAGENLAQNFFDNTSVVAGWLRSEGHRRNLLDQVYTEVGYAKCQEANSVVQFLAKPL